MKQFIIVLMVAAGFAATAQDKQMKKNNIKSVVETYIDYSTGVEVKYIESEQYFNPEGELIEIKDFKGGKFVMHEKYDYDVAGNKIKEVRYDAKGKIDRIVEYKYQGKLKTERIDYYPNGKVKSRKLYKYQIHE
jgi:hypothetical protein